MKFHTIFIWNIDTDTEEESWDVEGDYRLLWDSDGNPYIITKDIVIFTEKKCSIKAFDLKNFNTQSEVESTMNKGHRVDGKNHNWLIF